MVFKNVYMAQTVFTCLNKINHEFKRTMITSLNKIHLGLEKCSQLINVSKVIKPSYKISKTNFLKPSLVLSFIGTILPIKIETIHVNWAAPYEAHLQTLGTF